MQHYFLQSEHTSVHVIIKYPMLCSTISSNLSTLVATSFEDLIKPFVRHKSDTFHLWITRMLGNVIPLVNNQHIYMFHVLHCST